MFQHFRNSAPRSRAFGLRSACRDSGNTAALTGASRGSNRSTVRLSIPPLVFGASSSVYASIKNAMNDRVKPAAGSMTYGVYRTSLIWS
ncbi:Uncharacterised protein [Mycobacterium tuberculosis]|nr:Uncharacterised protein [Mycobacterium tuberculosis]SGC75945.1 Uncharacterised protein [Mycobacterium tuberculosis]